MLIGRNAFKTLYSYLSNTEFNSQKGCFSPESVQSALVHTHTHTDTDTHTHTYIHEYSTQIFMFACNFNPLTFTSLFLDYKFCFPIRLFHY